MFEVELTSSPKSDGKPENIVTTSLKGAAISLAIQACKEGFKLYQTLTKSAITIGEWDASYNRINKMIYELDKKKYTQYRVPTSSKEVYELQMGTSYIVKISDKNYAKIETYISDGKQLYREHRLSIRFYGKDKHKNRLKFMVDSLKLTDARHIHVKQLGSGEIGCDIIPHSFNNIILDEDVKHNIITGLTNWNKSKEWYVNHQLVHKIGVFLYGDPGTGKSTVARAISHMFENAPILTIDNRNVMGSINDIIRMRKRYDGTLIILIEDFDMLFRPRDEEDNNNPSATTEDSSNEKEPNNKRTRKKNNDLTDQNIIFQLLDGIYSTDETIYIATTNYKDKLDEALIRYGRFDIQEELKYFSKEQALQFTEMLDYDKSVLESMELTYPVQPSLLQSKIMKYRASQLLKGEIET